MVLVHPISSCDDMDAIRWSYHEVKSEAELNQLLKEIEGLDCDKKIPYLASLIMRQAEFTSWPHKKLGYFNDGKKMLENYLSAYPNSIEAHYIRLLTQKNVPSLLNYKQNILEDKQFVEQHLKSADLSEDYKRIMAQNIH